MIMLHAHNIRYIQPLNVDAAFSHRVHQINAAKAAFAAPGPGKQPGSPGKHSPSARLQAARSFFTSSRAAGCKAGHPQAVLQGLVQALHQLPTDLNQG